jgi:hypothetical protein
VFHERVAHLMRTGNFTTPRRASRSPSFTSGASGSAAPSSPAAPSRELSWIDIMALKAFDRSRTSSIERPFTAADIIDAADWLIEQPCPLMRMSRTVSPSRSR